MTWKVLGQCPVNLTVVSQEIRLSSIGLCGEVSKEGVHSKGVYLRNKNLGLVQTACP